MHMEDDAMPNLELTADTIARLVEGVRNLMLLLALPVAIFRGGTAGFQIMNSAGEMQDQVKARKALEHVFWGFLVVVLIAGVLTLFARIFRDNGLMPAAVILPLIGPFVA
jgi:hypothetical protein